MSKPSLAPNPMDLETQTLDQFLKIKPEELPPDLDQAARFRTRKLRVWLRKEQIKDDLRQRREISLPAR